MQHTSRFCPTTEPDSHKKEKTVEKILEAALTFSLVRMHAFSSDSSLLASQNSIPHHSSQRLSALIIRTNSFSKHLKPQDKKISMYLPSWLGNGEKWDKNKQKPNSLHVCTSFMNRGHSPPGYCCSPGLPFMTSGHKSSDGYFQQQNAPCSSAIA